MATRRSFGLIYPGRERKNKKETLLDSNEDVSKTAAATAMRTKLSTPEGSDLYRKRKAIVEPAARVARMSLSCTSALAAISIKALRVRADMPG